MEPTKVPLNQIAEGLKIDNHICNKELFAFVNRSLAFYGMQAEIYDIGDDHVAFKVLPQIRRL
jgi:hypothetical protein